jgi:glycosyltransferase involved in cell wall biosynthesis
MSAAAEDQVVAATHTPAGLRRARVAYLVSHPIQYQAPLLRRIAQEPGIDLTVFFASDFSLRAYRDRGFGVDVAWDIPLLEGYRHNFLPSLRDTGAPGIFNPISHGLWRRLKGDGQATRFDLLWLHGYASLNHLRALAIAKILGIPAVVRSDSTLRDRPRGRVKLLAKSLFFKALRPFLAGALAGGTLNRNYWEFYLGEDFPVFVMPYAVDNAFFQQRCREAASQREELRGELGLEPGRPVILFASKLQTRKRCRDLVAAYARLTGDPGQQPQPYLLIVGDGEERGALERQVAELGLTGVRFCGFRNQTELPRFLDLCTVFVLPAQHEPWGLIVNEAMNAARPVIVSDDVGGQPDLVTNGVEGLVYPVGNVDALADALRQILADPEAAQTMGRKALERVDAWDFEHDVLVLRQAIDQLCRQPRVAAPASGQMAHWEQS